MSLETIQLSIDGGIACVSLNRPAVANAMNSALWHDLASAFTTLARDTSVRVVVLDGTGRHFCAGMDLLFFSQLAAPEDAEPARARLRIRQIVLDLQSVFDAIEQCPAPVLAAVHGACLGGGLDMVSAADMRYCTANTFFGIHETRLGMTADLGSLQRLPRLIPDGLVRELAFTGRRMEAPEAHSRGLVNQVFDDKAQMMAGVMEIARQIAQRSPLAVTGCKHLLNYGRDHGVADGLDYIATWNAGMLSQQDLMAGVSAQLQKQEVEYPDLLAAADLGLPS